MKRKIKFRVWDKKRKEVICYSPDVEEYELVPFLTLAGEFVWIEYGERDWIDKVAVMQYIGLKDKNDKEIYEGDIVYNGQEYRRVVWARTGFWFASIHSKDKLIEPTANEVKNWEVVGNIFENPELLK